MLTSGQILGGIGVGDDCSILDISGRICGFEARYTLNGLFTGKVLIADPECEFEISCDLCQTVLLNLSSVTGGICPDCDTTAMDDCFSGELSDPNWVAGVITSIQEAGFFNDVPVVSANVVSFAEFLANKAINTELFNFDDLTLVLARVLDTYAGLASTWYDFSEIGIGEFVIRGPIQGNSTINELKRLAAAGYSHLSTQVGGVLTVQNWKDSSAAVDYVLTPELLVDVTKTPLQPGRTSLVRVRGMGISKYECGDQVFTDARYSSTAGGYISQGGFMRTCALSGVPTPDVQVTFDNLAASDEDIKNAEVFSDVMDNNGLYNLEDGTFGTNVEKTDGSWIDDLGTEYALMIAGKRRPQYEYRGGDISQVPFLQSFWQRYQEIQYQWSSLSPWPIPQPTFSSGGFGDVSGAYSADQTTIERIETEVKDPRISSCGIRSEQIDNPYITNKETLFFQGVRKFQEMRMEENTWFVETIYLPCLRLNDVVTFQTSVQDGCSAREVTGIISGIEVVYTETDKGPDVRMKLAIWAFDCIGGNSYTSGNLISFQCAGFESGPSNPWFATALGIDSQASMDENCGFLYTEGFPGTARLELTQKWMIPGTTYTISFDHELVGGFGAVQFTYPAGSVPISGTGSFSVPFAAPSSTGTFRWILSNTFIPTGFRICNVELKKTIIA